MARFFVKLYIVVPILLDSERSDKCIDFTMILQKG